MSDKEQTVDNIVKTYQEIMENKPLVIQTVLHWPQQQTLLSLSDVEDCIEVVGFCLDMCKELWRYIEETGQGITKREWYDKFWDFVSGQLRPKKEPGLDTSTEYKPGNLK